MYQGFFTMQRDADSSLLELARVELSFIAQRVEPRSDDMRWWCSTNAMRSNHGRKRISYILFVSQIQRAKPATRTRLQ